ncbi:hypothetical protein LEP3755_19300 [Leptolyngbya sp. NIES-3755]|nr:hypothetical protein LEP3755_19300 [Leptolyngbya sp. NIES-3755]
MKGVIRVLPWAMVAGAAWSIGAWFNLYYFQDPAWVNSIYTQKIARAEAIKAPRRILLVGGSSTHFGLQAERLQKKLNIPVVNLGLHAGLGLDGIFKLVQNEIRAGDIVVLFPEHDLLSYTPEENSGILATLVGLRSQRFDLLQGEQENPKNVANRLILVGSPRLFDVVAALRSEIFTRRKPTWYQFDVNQNGDSLDSLSGKPPFGETSVELSDASFQQIDHFRQFVEQRQGKLILGIPWKLAKSEPKTQSQLRQVIGSLSKIAPVVYNPKTLNLKEDISLFGDTTFHLTREGQKLRTEELAEQLRPLVTQKVARN